MFNFLLCIGLVLVIWNFLMSRSQKDKLTGIVTKGKDAINKNREEQ